MKKIKYDQRKEKNINVDLWFYQSVELFIKFYASDNSGASTALLDASSNLVAYYNNNTNHILTIKGEFSSPLKWYIIKCKRKKEDGSFFLKKIKTNKNIKIESISLLNNKNLFNDIEAKEKTKTEINNKYNQEAISLYDSIKNNK